MFPIREDPLLILAEALLVGNASDVIEQQEKRGQSLLINSTALPIKFNSGKKEQLEKFGVVFGAPIDDLFCEAILPDGWSKQATDHSMWSKLVDNQGRERASIFYKAAFYDRDAFINVSRRYVVSSFEPSDKDGNIVAYGKETHFATWILDSGAPMKLIAIRKKEYGSDETERNERDALEWIDRNYPDHRSNTAYWTVER